MEFWGVEVKPGETLNVEPEEGMILHLSQSTLGESKKDKGNDSILLNVVIGGQKLVIGHLSDKAPHSNHDLVFEKKFDLSHTWKNGSVHFCGYKTVLPDDGDEEFGFDSDSDEEEAEQALALPNGKPEPIAKAEKKEVAAKPAAAKPAAAKPAAAKPKVKIADPKKEEDDEDDSDDDEDDSDEDDESDDEDMLVAGDDSDDDDDDSEEETPKKVEQSKKRPAGSASKTPVPEKKAKLVTPQKTGGDGKKGAHTATPHPAKKAGNDAPKTPKSGSVTCGSCSKSFKSDQALQAHSKAKHSAGSAGK